MTNTNRVTIRETDNGFHVRCGAAPFGIHIRVQTLSVASRIKQILKTMPHSDERSALIDYLIKLDAESRITPSEFPPVRALMARREADVREGRLHLVWSR